MNMQFDRYRPLNNWRCKNVCLSLVLSMGGVLAIILFFRRSTGGELALNALRPLLRPTFGVGRAVASPPDLSRRETLEARVLAARASCNRRRSDAGAPILHRPPSSIVRGQLFWCGHRITLTKEINGSLVLLAEQNKNSKILLDVDSYYSMSVEGNLKMMSWNIVEHPLLLMVRTYLRLQENTPESAALASLVPGWPATFVDLLRLAVADADRAGSPLLASAGDTCDFCAGQFDFVLDAAQLETEVAFLVSEMGWTDTWATPGAGERHRRLLADAVRLLATVPKSGLRLLKQHLTGDLGMYGFSLDVDAIHDAVRL